MSLYHSPFLTLLRTMDAGTEVCKEGSTTLYASELVEKSLGAATNLAKKGIKRGDPVLFAMDTGIEFLIVFMALLHLRVKIALVDPHMGPHLYQAKIRQLKPKWAFIDRRLLFLQEQRFIKKLYTLKNSRGLFIPRDDTYTTFGTGPWVPLYREYERLKFEHSTFELLPAGQDDEIIIVYTSGTLAEPKGVVQTVNSIYNSLFVLSSILEKKPNQAMVSHLPHFALIGMMTGYKTHFWKESSNAKSRIHFLESNNITTLFGPPAEFLPLIEFCKKNKRIFPTPLNHIILGSAPIYKNFIGTLRKYYGGKITCLYGMTEHVLISSIDGDEKLAYPLDQDVLGKPFHAMDYYVADDGELMVKAQYTFKRYVHQSERAGFHPTGDLVLLDSDGNLVMKGRKKNMIIRAHKNIYPALYESTINSIEGVKEACMLGYYNEQKHDEEVILLVESDNGLTEEHLRKQLKSGPNAIDSDAIPDHFVFMKIPKTGRQQKVDYQYLRKHLKSLCYR